MHNEDKRNRLKAFEKVVDTFESALLRYASRLTNNPTTAEDIVQNAFVKFIKNWNGPYDAYGDIKPWLYRVVHNEAVDFIRAEARRQKLHDEHGDECIGRTTSPTDNHQDTDEILLALNQLTTRERELVILKVYEEKSYKEIAEITGLTTNNVGVSLHAAMKKLASILDKKGGDYV